MKEPVYVIIDEYLTHLKLNPLGGSSTSIREYSLSTGANAKKLMFEHELIYYRNPGNPNSIIDITNKGFEVSQNGGFKIYIEKLEASEAEKKRLDNEKLKVDLANAKRISKTYWWTFSFAVAALLISIYNLIHGMVAASAK